MTTNRETDKSGEGQERPRIQKEKLKDLGVKEPESVKGGVKITTQDIGFTTRNAKYC